MFAALFGELDESGDVGDIGDVGDDVKEPPPPRVVLTDIGLGTVVAEREDGIVEVKLPFGICYAQKENVRSEIEVTFQTFYTNSDSSKPVPASLTLKVDLSAPASTVISALAERYGVNKEELLLIAEGRVLTLEESRLQQLSLLGRRGAATGVAVLKGDGGARRFDLITRPPYRCLVVVYERLLRFTRIDAWDGVFYFIGTREGTRPWQNPIRSGQIQVVMSSRGGEEESCIADRMHPFARTAENSYADDNDPWIAIHIKHYQVRPTHYVIAQQEDHILRNWVFEGSNDPNPNFRQKRWEVLDERRNDTSLPAARNPSAVFTVPDCKKFYSFFRIHVTGPSHKGRKSFDISQLELYGYITPKEDKNGKGKR